MRLARQGGGRVRKNSGGRVRNSSGGRNQKAYNTEQQYQQQEGEEMRVVRSNAGSQGSFKKL